MLRRVGKFAILTGSFLSFLQTLPAQEGMPKHNTTSPSLPLPQSHSTSPTMISESAPITSGPIVSGPVSGGIDCGTPTAIECGSTGVPCFGGGITRHFPRPKVILQQQEPEVIFRRVPTTTVRVPSSSSGCNTGDCGGNGVTQSVRNQGGVPQSAPGTQSTPQSGFVQQQSTSMALTAVPVVSYQMQAVPVVSYQYQMTPVQQNLFVPQVAQQSSFVNVQQATQPAFFNQNFTAQTQAGLGATIGAGLIEEILRSLLTNRGDSAIQDLINNLLKQRGSQNCPDDVLQELTRQIRALNDRIGGTTTPDKKPTNDKVLDSLTKMTDLLDRMNTKLEEHDKLIKELKEKK